MKKINFHTHTFHCTHAVGTVDDYCQKAVELDFIALGFSEHVPYKDGTERKARIPFENLPLYRQEIRDAKKKFPQLKIFAGLELEAEPRCFEDYRQLKEELELDYMIGGAHFIRDDEGNVFWFFHKDTTQKERLIAMKEEIRLLESGLLTYLAHPDAFLMNVFKYTPDLIAACRDLCQTARDLNIPLELNCNGMKKKVITPDGTEITAYPRREFWEIAAECGVSCVVGIDAHYPVALEEIQFEMLHQFAADLKIPVVNEEILRRLS